MNPPLHCAGACKVGDTVTFQLQEELEMGVSLQIDSRAELSCKEVQVVVDVNDTVVDWGTLYNDSYTIYVTMCKYMQFGVFRVNTYSIY